jgi:hypothetical protein
MRYGVESELETYFDMLPDVRFGIDDTHIRLICPTIYEDPIIHLEKCIPSIILACCSVKIKYARDRGSMTNRRMLACHSTFSEWDRKQLVPVC